MHSVDGASVAGSNARFSEVHGRGEGGGDSFG